MSSTKAARRALYGVAAKDRRRRPGDGRANADETARPRSVDRHREQAALQHRLMQGRHPDLVRTAHCRNRGFGLADIEACAAKTIAPHRCATLELLQQAMPFGLQNVEGSGGDESLDGWQGGGERDW